MNAIKTILTGISATLRRRMTSQESRSPNDRVVFMTLEEARKNPALVKEMYRQLNEASIINGTEAEFVAGVAFHGRQYYVSAPHNEWLLFYGMESSRGRWA